ncbi:MAG TPA: ATP-binding cassette domain-containing protein [Planctomycetes bacterium]|nr:ATP-binding cassette domain-containing protein [Planctomycetota bacterium]
MSLEVQGLCVNAGEEPLVRDLSFTVHPGSTTALLGPSGAGKTLTALSLLDLLPEGVHVTGGRVRLDKDARAFGPDLRPWRGKHLGMIFQEPRCALPPSTPVGRVLAAALRRAGLSARDARRRAVWWLERVGIPDGERRYRDPPHRFSGGELQRVLTALALAQGPRYLLADEPTSNLDVTVQGQILGLLKRLQAEDGLGLLLITHDERVVRALADDEVRMVGAASEEGEE